MLLIRQNEINHVRSNAGKENATEQVHQITKGGQHRSPAPIGFSLLVKASCLQSTTDTANRRDYS